MIEVLFIVAVAVAGAVLGIFIVGRRYRQGEPAFSPVEVEWLKKEAEGRISAISPRVMDLSEKERDLTRLLDRAELDGESRAGAEEFHL